MKRFLVVIGLVWVGIRLEFPTWVIRYRLTPTAEVDGHEVSGSGVLETRWASEGFFTALTGVPWDISVHGEGDGRASADCSVCFGRARMWCESVFRLFRQCLRLFGSARLRRAPSTEPFPPHVNGHRVSSLGLSLRLGLLGLLVGVAQGQAEPRSEGRVLFRFVSINREIAIPGGFFRYFDRIPARTAAIEGDAFDFRVVVP